MTITPYPRHILFEKWADIGFSWTGNVSLFEFNRLYHHLNPVAQVKNPTLTITATLSNQDGTIWLNTFIKGILWLDCHRCLHPINKLIDDHYTLAIVRHDSEITTLQQKEAEYVFWHELQSDGRMLPLFDIIEDELILSLPLSITHDNCKMAIKNNNPDKIKESPFMILAELKNKP